MARCEHMVYDRTTGGRGSLRKQHSRTHVCKFHFQLDSGLRKFETCAESNINTLAFDQYAAFSADLTDVVL